MLRQFCSSAAVRGRGCGRPLVSDHELEGLSVLRGSGWGGAAASAGSGSSGVCLSAVSMGWKPPLQEPDLRWSRSEADLVTAMWPPLWRRRCRRDWMWRAAGLQPASAAAVTSPWSSSRPLSLLPRAMFSTDWARLTILRSLRRSTWSRHALWITAAAACATLLPWYRRSSTSSCLARSSGLSSPWQH